MELTGLMLWAYVAGVLVFGWWMMMERCFRPRETILIAVFWPVWGLIGLVCNLWHSIARR